MCIRDRSNFGRSGTGCLVSYRDPKLAATDKIYEGIPEYLKNFSIDERDMTKYVIAVSYTHLDVYKRQGKQFDLVFMDAAKGQYLNWLPLLLDLMPVGAVLISDNVLQDGDVVQSRFAVQRRNRTIHSRMREYLYELKHMEDVYKRQAMPDQIPEQIKGVRSDRLLALEQKMSEGFRKGFIGEKVSVLFEEMITVDGKEYLVGHTPEYVKAALPKEECEKMHAASGVILEAEAKDLLTSDILLLKNTIAE